MGIGGDPFFNSVVFLLPMSGTNGSTTFIDQSSYARAMTASSGAAISNGQTLFGQNVGGFSINNVSALLSFGSLTGISWTGSWTFEAHVYMGARTTGGIYASRNQYPTAGNEIHFGVGASSLLRIETQIGGTPTNTLISNAPSLTGAGWDHVAFVKSGSTLFAFVNGIQCGYTTNIGDSQTYTADGTGGIGSGDAVGQVSSPNYMANVRGTIGVARYTSNFTPPSAPYPLGGIPPYMPLKPLLRR